MTCLGAPVRVVAVMQQQPTDSEANAPLEPPVLSSTQRKTLRGKAHRLEPVVHVGQAGVTPEVLASVAAALLAHELIKVRLHEPEDKRRDADQLASGTASALCGLVGHTVILYRPHPDRPRITLD